MKELWKIYSSSKSTSFLLASLGILLVVSSLIPQGTTDKFILTHYLFSEARWITFFGLNNIADSPLTLFIIFLLSINLSAQIIEQVMNSSDLRKMLVPSLSAIVVILAVILYGSLTGAEDTSDSSLIRVEDTLSGRSSEGLFEAGEVYENDALKIRIMVVRYTPMPLVAIKSGEELLLYSRTFTKGKQEKFRVSQVSTLPASAAPFRQDTDITLPVLIFLAGMTLFLIYFHGVSSAALSGGSSAIFTASPGLLLLTWFLISNQRPFLLNSADGRELQISVSYFDASLQSDFTASIPVAGTFASSEILIYLLGLVSIVTVISSLLGMPRSELGKLLLLRVSTFILISAALIPIFFILFSIPVLSSAEVHEWFSNEIIPVLAPAQTILGLSLSGLEPYTISFSGAIPFLIIPSYYGIYLLLQSFGLIKWSEHGKSFLQSALLSVSFLLILAAAAFGLRGEPWSAPALIGACSTISAIFFSRSEKNGYGSGAFSMISLFVLFLVGLII